jgi:hypothetical protein
LFRYSITIPEKTTEKLISDAVEKAVEQDADASPVVTLDLSKVEQAKAAILDVNAAKTFSDANVSVTVKLPGADVTIDPAALAKLAAASNVGTTPITVEAAAVLTKDLSKMQEAQVSGYGAVINIDIYVGKDKVSVPATISLPYILNHNQDPKAVRVWYLDDKGNLTKLDSVYNKEAGMITFTVNHQSYFVAGYDPVALWVNIFSDVNADAWYYDAVAFANYHNLFSGYGGGVFAPQDSMTRAMFAAVLYKMDSSPKVNGNAGFDDVTPGEWYHDAVIWAAESGVAGGVGEGMFAPNRPVTRQEMAAMLMNYANYKGYDIPENRPAPDYTDYNQIDMWAETAAKKLSEAGVLSGDGDGFKPGKTATRAEVAQMFKNFLRLIAGAGN